MEQVIDARGLRCPLPYVKARAALDRLPDGEALVVLATDPEAPVDIGALAADHGMTCAVVRDGAGWRITLQSLTPRR
jgi:tRNA 2-thiouridine synthesizing protein A